MNLYCKDQKTFTKKGKDNWEKVFSCKYVVIEQGPLDFKIEKCYKKNNTFVYYNNDEVINSKLIVGICDSYNDCNEIIKSMR